MLVAVYPTTSTLMHILPCPFLYIYACIILSVQTGDNNIDCFITPFHIGIYSGKFSHHSLDEHFFFLHLYKLKDQSLPTRLWGPGLFICEASTVEWMNDCACKGVGVWECVATIRKLARECSNKRLISKNGVRRAKTQDELRLAKKKKNARETKSPLLAAF